MAPPSLLSHWSFPYVLRRRTAPRRTTPCRAGSSVKNFTRDLMAVREGRYRWDGRHQKRLHTASSRQRQMSGATVSSRGKLFHMANDLIGTGQTRTSSLQSTEASIFHHQWFVAVRYFLLTFFYFCLIIFWNYFSLVLYLLGWCFLSSHSCHQNKSLFQFSSSLTLLNSQPFQEFLATSKYSE